jgi:hypothetical protein
MNMGRSGKKGGMKMNKREKCGFKREFFFFKVILYITKKVQCVSKYTRKYT